MNPQDGRKTPDEGGIVLHSPEEPSNTSNNTVEPKQLRESGVVRPSPRLPREYVPQVAAREKKTRQVEEEALQGATLDSLQGTLQVNTATYDNRDAMSLDERVTSKEEQTSKSKPGLRKANEGQSPRSPLSRWVMEPTLLSSPYSL